MKLSDKNNLVKTNGKQKALKFSIFMFIAIVLIGGISYGVFYFNKSYQDKIFPRVTIAGQVVGGKTKDQAKQIVLDYINKIDQDGPEISYKTQVLNPKFSQLGISFNIDEVVDAAYNYGRSNDYLLKSKDLAKLIQTKKDFPLNPVLEEKILAQYFDFVSSTVNIAPKNSTVIYSDGHFVATDSKSGTGLDQADFDTKIKAFINGGETKLELKTGALEPNINQEDTTEAIASAEKYIQSAPITVIFEDKKFTADKTEIAKWIAFVESNNKLIAEISNKKIDQFVDPIVSAIEIKKIDRETVIDTGKVLNEGSDGRGVDRDKLFNDIKSVILNNTKNSEIAVSTFAVGKGEKRVAAVFAPGEYVGRYIDINLGLQILQLIDNNKVIQEYQVSTGKWSMPTPVGVRYIESKNDMAWSNKYQLYMPWWNSIGGGYGIHELPMWPGGYHEGEGHLGTPVSHGCIRLGIGPAETVYNWAPVGTPVNIHE